MSFEVIILLFGLLGLLLLPLQGEAPSACRPADGTSARMVAWVKAVVTGTDPASSRTREQLKLPQVTASHISYVTEAKICRKIVPPYNARTVMQDSTGSVTPSGVLYVVKVGTMYVASDPAKDAGEFSTLVTLDSKFRVLASSLG